MTAFIGSGKNKSPTTWLTEDEDRDRYDNLDELIAVGDRSSSTGLGSAGRRVDRLRAEHMVQPEVGRGGQATLSPDNALGERFVGAEVGLHNRFELGDYDAHRQLQALVPGSAVAAFVNDVDRRAPPRLWGEARLLATF